MPLVDPPHHSVPGTLSMKWPHWLSDGAGVEEDAAWGTKSSRRNVFIPLRADNAGIAMRTAALAHLLCLVDVSQALAEIKLGIIPSPNTVNLDQSAVRIGIVLAALEAENGALGIETCDRFFFLVGL